MKELLPTIRKFFAGGFALGIGLFASFVFGSAITGTIHTFVTSQPISSAQINENFTTLRRSIEDIKEVPVGTIVAWHKSLTGTPNLPAGWVECSGQTISDTASVYDGQTIPDLNNDAGAGQGGRFLRGNTISGTLQGDLFASHTHNVINMRDSQGGGNMEISRGNGNPAPSGITSATGGAETRPVNMSVVWIIKIK